MTDKEVLITVLGKALHELFSVFLISVFLVSNCMELGMVKYVKR